LEGKRLALNSSVLLKPLQFILHIPSEERGNTVRECFQIEFARFFYLGLYVQNTPGLPQCGIRDFAKADILFLL
uniref:mRNA decapping protein 2 Box A domain-containing protein n=1 Tax=Calidris pygmaea TaxID=425635 RepID=A0A8C3J907_9CHAR